MEAQDRRLDSALDAFEQLRAGDPVIGEIGLGGIHTDRQAQGLEKTEQRAQLVIDDQGMALRPPVAASSTGTLFNAW